uniref:Uncharacterized protein n=1 Tax=Caenorhabditis japonica TaxID=281687 RepID=A0A8R1E736_CAEJA
MLVSLLSVYQHLESGTDLENRAIAYANVIWSHAHQHLLEKLTEKDNDDSFTENLQLFALLRNAVRISGYYEILAEKIQNHENHLKDTHGFAHFHCPTALKFPLKLEELLGRENEQEPVDIGEENEEENEEEEEQEKGKNYHKESDSSDEEILQRGRRRGRARQLESVDTDEEDF